MTDTIESNSALSADEKNLAMLAHLGGTIFTVFPSLIIWLVKRDDSPYISEQAREALNFQITVMIAQMINAVLIIILIGGLLMAIVWVANIIFCILAAVAASKGEHYRYPFTLRLLN